jgi:hypothetical protein
MNDTTNTAALTVGQPVAILTGLPYSMTWEEIDDLEGKEGILVRVDTDEFEPLPYGVQLVEGGEPVRVQEVRPIADPAHALHVATQATARLATRADAVAGAYYEYSLSAGGRLACVQEFAETGDVPDGVRAELRKLLAED